MNAQPPDDFSNTRRSTSSETISFDHWTIPPPPYSPPASQARVDQYFGGPRTVNVRHSIDAFHSNNVQNDPSSPICPSSHQYTCQCCSEVSIFLFKFITGRFLIVITICLAFNVFLMGVLISRMGAEPNACHASTDLDHTMQMWNHSQHQALLLFKYEKEMWASMRDEEQLQIMGTISQLREFQRELDQDRMDWMKGRRTEDRHNSKCSLPVDTFMAAIELEGAENCSAYELKDHRAKIKGGAYYLGVNDIIRLQFLRNPMV